jgi:hypothetical protein
MNSRIIFSADDGVVAVIIPADECGLTIDDIAKKDVPAGVPYKIVDASDIPEDRTFRGAWEADITEPDGVGLGYDAWFALQPKPVEVEDDYN